jgi:hypothetical protein
MFIGIELKVLSSGALRGSARNKGVSEFNSVTTDSHALVAIHRDV